MKRKVLLVAAAAAVTFSLTGCSAINQIALKQSGIADDENYQQYLSYVSAGKLDEDGYYIEDTDEEIATEEASAGSIQVTFARNSCLDIQYYTDSAKSSPINASNCYLNPGDSVYADVKIRNDVFSSAYEFSGFRIYEYKYAAGGAANRILSVSLTMEREEGSDLYKLSIPTDYTGTDISIIPIGKTSVSVSLPQPDAGGTIIYKVNGATIEGDNIRLYSGDEIAMEFIAWEGWISPSGESVYTVGTDSVQAVTVGGKDINDLFYEDQGHKPKLSVSLETSVDTDMCFSVTASGYSASDMHRSTHAITDDKVIKGERIGTDKPIELSVSNKALQSGTAIRITVTRTTDKKQTITETRYIDTLSSTIDPIYIYQPGTNATAKEWYSSIEIAIGIADVAYFTAAPSPEHTNISVASTEDNTILTDGVLVESTQKVTVTLTPESGYYIEGSKGSDSFYSETMTYSKYLEGITNILENHSAKKYCVLTLDESDAYASYSYKLDGEEVSGKVNARINSTLKLTYKLTDSNYQLTDTIAGIFKETTKSLKVTADMDGTVITKADFGIQVKEGS